MIWLRFDVDRLRGNTAGIYGQAGDGRNPSASGKFKLFPDGEGGEDPALEGDNAIELDSVARALGAIGVEHWYEP